MVEYKKELDHFQFAQRIIPYYDIIHKTVKSLVSISDDSSKALDLGIGSGGLALQLLIKYSNLKIDGIDLSESMLQKAEGKLAKYQDRINLIQADFTKKELSDNYDFVYSVFAIHYVTDSAKRKLFEDIYDHLKPDGYFIYADIFNSSSNFLSDLYKLTWKKHMLSQGILDQYADCWVEDHVHKANTTTITNTVEWLKCANFSEVHSIWKYYGFAVLYARK